MKKLLILVFFAFVMGFVLTGLVHAKGSMDKDYIYWRDYIIEDIEKGFSNPYNIIGEDLFNKSERDMGRFDRYYKDYQEKVIFKYRDVALEHNAKAYIKREQRQQYRELAYEEAISRYVPVKLADTKPEYRNMLIDHFWGGKVFYEHEFNNTVARHGMMTSGYINKVDVNSQTGSLNAQDVRNALDACIMMEYLREVGRVNRWYNEYEYGQYMKDIEAKRMFIILTAEGKWSM